MEYDRRRGPTVVGFVGWKRFFSIIAHIESIAGIHFNNFSVDLTLKQRRSPVKFEFACATVDPQTTSFDPSPLIPYLKSLGIDYHYLSEPIVDLAKSKLQVSLFSNLVVQ